MPPSKDQTNILRAPGDYEVTKTVHSSSYADINPRSLKLQQYAVFITGGSRGLGKSMAISFAKAGVSKIAVGARSNLESVEKAVRDNCDGPVEFLAVEMDVCDAKSVEAAAVKVEIAFGKLNVVVNNAGILGKYGVITESLPDEWWQVLDVNLKGPYLVTRSFIPLLLKAERQEPKYIVNICSGGAHLTNPTLSAYQVAKGALLRFTTLTDREYSAQGITAFAIHPGNVPTAIMGGPSAIPSHHKHVFVDSPELGGDSIAFLTSQRRPWLGGRYINCTWDLPELLSKKDLIVQGDKLKTKFDFEL